MESVYGCDLVIASCNRSCLCSASFGSAWLQACLQHPLFVSAGCHYNYFLRHSSWRKHTLARHVCNGVPNSMFAAFYACSKLYVYSVSFTIMRYMTGLGSCKPNMLKRVKRMGYYFQILSLI